MRYGCFMWSPDKGHVGTTSGSGGAEEFVSPKVSQQEHLRPPEIKKPIQLPSDTAGEVQVADTGLEGSEAGPDNPARGTD